MMMPSADWDMSLPITKMTVGMSFFSVSDPDVEATPLEDGSFPLPSSCSTIIRELGVSNIPCTQIQQRLDVIS